MPPLAFHDAGVIPSWTSIPSEQQCAVYCGSSGAGRDVRETNRRSHLPRPFLGQVDFVHPDGAPTRRFTRSSGSGWSAYTQARHAVSNLT